MNILLDLFLTFAKIGCFTFGGAYAMLPFIETACVEEKQWISHDEMMDITVIAESTPGPISINCATYTGFRQAGLAGATMATLGLVVPSFTIIFIISVFLNDFLSITLVAKAFLGIKAAVGVLIVDAGITMIKKMKKRTPFSMSLMAISFAIIIIAELCAWNFTAVVVMVVAGIIGLVVHAGKSLQNRRGEAR